MTLSQHNIPERILWVDIMKGILILLMVLGHCGTPMVKLIYTFHMPAFLFLSGFTAHPDKHSFLAYLKNKFFTLLFPYILWNVVFIIIYRILHRTGIFVLLDESWNITLVDFFSKSSTADLGGATWFLLVLFTTSIFYYILQASMKLLKLESYTPYFALVLGYVGHYLGDNGNYLPYMMDSSMYALFYYGMGKLFAQNDIFDSIPEKPMAIVCIASATVFGFMYPNLLMNWPSREYTGILEEAVGAIAGIYVCYKLSIFLSSDNHLKKILIVYGKNSLVVLIFHFLTFRVIFGFFVLLGLNSPDILKNLTPPNDWHLQWLVVWCLSLLLCWGMIKLANLTVLTRFVFKGEIKR